MKAFYTVICLFAIMLGAIAFNYFYICNLSQELISELEQLALPSAENDTALQAERIRNKWNESRRFAQITVNHTEIEMISNAADELCVFAKCGDITEFERARSIFINTLEELELSEKLSPTNIL